MALTSAMLEKLPLALSEQIADIARLLDTHAMEIKIAEVQKIDIATANGLQVLTQEFVFEQIMDLLTAAQGHG